MSMLEYLQKHYIDAQPKEKKKKRKRRKEDDKIKIIDYSEGDWNNVVNNSEDEDIELDELPAVAETMDERPAEIVEIEKYRASSTWKPLKSSEASQKLMDSPRHRKRHDSIDASPPRKRHSSSDASPSRKRHDSSDASPPRKRHNSSDASPPRKRHDSSDASPPRKRHDSSNASPPRKRHDSSDASPPRKRHDSSDASPPRKRHDSSDASPPRKPKEKLPPKEVEPRNSKSENETIYRDRATGKKKELNKDLEVKQKLIQDKVAKWKTGAAQIKQQQTAAEEAVHEMGKDFTRSTGDVDLEKYLKEQTHEDDPMADYLSKKKAKREKSVVYPKYKGSWPANRFNIPPGYRWDGVDRSNGFERKYFESINNKKAFAEAAHKWSVEDM